MHDNNESPPHDNEAEKAVLGSLLISPSSWNIVQELLCEDDFYNQSHKKIFTTIIRLLNDNQPVDVVTVSEELEKNKELADVGDFSYLAELAKNTPSAPNVEVFAKVIKEYSLERLSKQIQDKVSKGNSILGGRGFTNILDLAARSIECFADQARRDYQGTKSVDLLKAKASVQSKMFHNYSIGVSGVPTGFKRLNKLTNGLQKGDLIIVAARPSLGKTTFALNLCETAMMTQVEPVLVFSLEMPSELIALRIVSSMSQVDQTKIRTNRIDADEQARIFDAMVTLETKRNLFVNDSSKLTPMELSALALKFVQEKGGVSLIMIDYLQLMQEPSLSKNRQLEIASMCQSLKALAQELNVPVVVLSQLDRSLEQREDKRPVISDLFNSARVGQIADLIMFIYRDEVYNENSKDRGVAEVKLVKQGDVLIGNSRLKFQGQFSRFEDYIGPIIE